MPFFTRLMSSQQYGVVTVYNSWMAIVLALVCLNIYGGCFNKMMMVYEDRRSELASCMFGLITTLCLLAMAVALLWPGFFATVLGIDERLVLPLMLNVYATGGFTLWSVYRRFEYRYKSLLVATVFYVVLAAVVSIACVAAESDDAHRALVRVSSNIAVILPLAIFLGVALLIRGRAFFRADMWRYALRFVIPLLPHYLSMILMGQIGRLFVAYYCGEAQAAYFGVCYQLSIAMGVITASTINAVVPWMYTHIKNSNFDGMPSVFNAISAGIAAAVLLLSLLAPEVLALFAPEEYRQAASLIPIMAASTFFTYLYSLYVNVEFYYEKRAAVSAISIAAAAIDIALCVWLIPVQGYGGAACAMLLAYIFMGIGHVVVASRICSRESLPLFDNRMILGMGAALVAACACAAGLYALPAVARYCAVGLLVALALGMRGRIRLLISTVRGNDA